MGNIDVCVSPPIITVGDNGKSLPHAYLNKNDLRQGKKIIYLGGAFYPPHYNTEYLQGNMDIAFTHESTHIIIYEITKSFESSAKLDNVDNFRTDFLVSQSSTPKAREVK